MTAAHRRTRDRRRGTSRLGKIGTVLLIIVAVLVVLGALGAGTWAALHSRWFAATSVTVTGARHESPAEVEQAAGLADAPPMISVNPAAVSQRVQADFPWVATATVTRRWPHTVTIVITERRPVAFVSTRSGVQEVDVTGLLLGKPPAGEVLPTLAVAAPPADPHGTRVLGTAAHPGLVVAATLPPAFAQQVATISVDAKGSVTIALTSPLTFVLGPASDLAAKYEDIAAVIHGATMHAGDVIDVSVPQAMTVTGP